MSDNLIYNDVSDVFNTIDKLENILTNYISSTINNTYISVEKDIAVIIDEIIMNRQMVNSNNLTFVNYAKKQVEFIDIAIDLIENSKFENLNLYKAFESIKNNLIGKKNQFDVITKTKKDLSGFDEIKSTLEKNIMYFEMKFQAGNNAYNEECFKILKEFETSQLVKILSQINTDIFKEDIENFYTVYSNCVMDLDKKTNELEIKDLSKFIKSDRKSLGEIIDLLSNFELSFISYPENDIMLIKIISKSVIDIMVETQNEFREIESADKVELLLAKPLSLQSFKNIVEKNSIEIISNEDTFIKFATLVQGIDNLFANLNKQFCEKLSKNIKSSDFENFKEVVLTNDLIDVFKEIVDYINNNIDSLSDVKEKEIINGILETITIKVSNLDENKTELEKCFKSNCLKMKDDIFNKIKAEIFKIENSDGSKIKVVEKVKPIEDIVSSIVFENDFEVCSNNLFDDEIDNIKRNVILQEISTFEEIINQSIEATGNEPFIKYMNDSNEKIIEILGRNSITIILPKEKEKFNSKEQFIIVAEKDDNYSKGEIIKVVNVGFKENDEVLIKANIICAM